jgi:hypothetical protein
MPLPQQPSHIHGEAHSPVWEPISATLVEGIRTRMSLTNFIFIVIGPAQSPQACIRLLEDMHPSDILIRSSLPLHI